MAKPEIHTKKTKLENKSSLKGTLVAVFLLGFFLIFTWFSVYQIFLNRL
ncbi:MAG: cytochrome c oxidase subunit 2A [Ectobacillus sp.]